MMAHFLISLFPWVFIYALESTRGDVETPSNNATAVFYGRGEERIAAILKSMGPLQGYNGLFPSLNPGEDNVTTVKLSLKDMVVKDYNNEYQKEKMVIEALLVSEWKDSRLKFKVPWALRGDEADFINTDFTGPLEQKLWRPIIKSKEIEVIKGSANHATFIGSDGTVYSQQEVILNPRSVQINGKYAFKAELTVAKHTTRDLILNWRNIAGTISPFSFKWKEQDYWIWVAGDKPGTYAIDAKGYTRDRVVKLVDYCRAEYSTAEVTFTFLS